jgi:hypothetical protein
MAFPCQDRQPEGAAQHALLLQARRQTVVAASEKTLKRSDECSGIPGILRAFPSCRISGLGASTSTGVGGCRAGPLVEDIVVSPTRALDARPANTMAAPPRAARNCVRLGRFSDARPTTEGRVYSVHPPGGLRVLWDNLLKDKQYAFAIFLPLIARQVVGRNTGNTP